MPGEASGNITCSTRAPALITHTVEYGKAASVTVQTWASKDFYHATRSAVCRDADYTGLKGMRCVCDQTESDSRCSVVEAGQTSIVNALRLLVSAQSCSTTYRSRFVPTDWLIIGPRSACHINNKHSHPELTKHKRIIELGCGVGALGVLLSTTTECSHVCITDGSTDALQLAEVNTATTANVSVATLYWGNAAQEAAVLQTSGAYDVCIGADLMYYNVDTAQLITTALRMIEGNSTGFILLAHLCRSPVMQDQLMELAKQRGLVILDVPIESFTTDSDRECIHCWYNLKLLLVYAAADAVDHPCASFITSGIAHELQSATDDASASSEQGQQQELISCFDDTLFE
eukprot:14027-Heterococcus_DN1.PRE.2